LKRGERDSKVINFIFYFLRFTFCTVWRAEAQHPKSLDQWFPTGGSRTPGGPKQHFQGSEMRF